MYASLSDSKCIIAILKAPEVSPRVVTKLIKFNHVLYVVTTPICSVVRILVNRGMDITVIPCEQMLANTNTMVAFNSIETFLSLRIELVTLSNTFILNLAFDVLDKTLWRKLFWIYGIFRLQWLRDKLREYIN